MHEELNRALKNLSGADPLARLGAIGSLRDLAETALREVFEAAELEQVRMARSMRPTTPWEEIGAKLRISRQAAEKRYKHLL